MHANDHVGSWHAWYAELAAICFFGPFILGQFNQPQTHT
jgi:hypothetical protein